MGSTSFLGFSCLQLLLVFLNLLFLGTYCYIFFRKGWDFLWVFRKNIYVPHFGLGCDETISYGTEIQDC